MKIEGGKIKLSAGERRAFFQRDWPELAGKGESPDLVQTRYALSSRLSFTVDKIHRHRKGWRLEYSVVDDREERFYLLPAGVKLDVSEDGIPQLLPEEEIGYTRNPKRRHVDELPTVTPDVQKVLDMRSRLQAAQRIDEDQEMAERRNRQQARSINRALTQYAVWAARNGVSVAPLFAQIEKLLSELDDDYEAAA